MDAKNGGEEEEESNHAPVTRRGKKRGVGKRSVSLNAKVIFQFIILYFTRLKGIFSPDLRSFMKIEM